MRHVTDICGIKRGNFTIYFNCRDLGYFKCNSADILYLANMTSNHHSGPHYGHWLIINSKYYFIMLYKGEHLTQQLRAK